MEHEHTKDMHNKYGYAISFQYCPVLFSTCVIILYSIIMYIHTYVHMHAIALWNNDACLTIRMQAGSYKW